MSAIQYPLLDATIVIVTGMVIVFLALVALIVLIKLVGAVFQEHGKTPSAPSAPAAPAVPAPVPAAMSEEEMAVVTAAALASSDLSEEEVAVISAAVAATMAGSSGYVITGITRRRPGERPVWGLAGMIENTRPF